MLRLSYFFSTITLLKPAALAWLVCSGFLMDKDRFLFKYPDIQSSDALPLDSHFTGALIPLALAWLIRVQFFKYSAISFSSFTGNI